MCPFVGIRWSWETRHGFVGEGERYGRLGPGGACRSGILDLNVAVQCQSARAEDVAVADIQVGYFLS